MCLERLQGEGKSKFVKLLGGPMCRNVSYYTQVISRDMGEGQNIYANICIHIFSILLPI